MLNRLQNMRVSFMMALIVAGINGASTKPSIVVLGESSHGSMTRSRSMSDIAGTIASKDKIQHAAALRLPFFYPDPANPVPLSDCMQTIKNAETDSGSLILKTMYGSKEVLLSPDAILNESMPYAGSIFYISWGRFIAGMMPSMLAIAAGSYFEYDIKKVSHVAVLLSCLPICFGVYGGAQKVTIPWDNFNKKKKSVHNKLNAKLEQCITIDSQRSCLINNESIPAGKRLSALTDPTFATEVHDLFMETKDETKIDEVRAHNGRLAYNLRRVIDSVHTDVPRPYEGRYTRLQMSELDEHVVDPVNPDRYRDYSSRFLQTLRLNWMKFQCDQENRYRYEKNNKALGWGLGGVAGIALAFKYFDTFMPQA
jgi:hypothetical protein